MGLRMVSPPILCRRPKCTRSTDRNRRFCEVPRERGSGLQSKTIVFEFWLVGVPALSVVFGVSENVDGE